MNPVGAESFCTNCGRTLPDGSDFCPHCGNRTESNPGFCSCCGASVGSGADCCPNCGEATLAGIAQSTQQGAIGFAGVEYVGFWVRFAAFIIDAVIISVAAAIIKAIIGIPAIGTALSIAYYVLFIGLQGQTPGKMALGIQVVNKQGNVPGIGRAALREIVGKFVSAIVILLGYFWIIWDKEKRGWHDHIAGTYVMRKRKNP